LQTSRPLLSKVCRYGSKQIMRKKSKYKPKGVRLDAVNWVLAGMKPVASVGDAIVVLKAKNHSALTEVVQGRGNRDQIDVLIAALNMCEAYAVHGKAPAFFVGHSVPPM